MASRRIPHYRFVLLLCFVLSAHHVADARTWVTHDGQKTVEGSLLDYREGEVRIALDDGGIESLDFEDLSAEDRVYVAHAAKAASQFGVFLLAAESSPKDEERPQARKGRPVVALRLNIQPDTIKSFCVVGEEPRRIVIQQARPNESIALIHLDAASGKKLVDCGLPPGARLLDLSPDGSLAVLHRADKTKRIDAIEVWSLESGESVWRLPDRPRSKMLHRSFRFADEDFLIEFSVKGGDDACSVWQVAPKGLGSYVRKTLRPHVLRLADLCDKVVGCWNRLGLAAIDARFVGAMRNFGLQTPLKQWTMPGQRLEFIRHEGETRAFSHSSSGVREVDPATGRFAGFACRVPGLSLSGGSIALDSRGTVAFVGRIGPNEPYSLIVAGNDGNIRSRIPIHGVGIARRIAATGCVRLDEGYWGLVTEEETPSDSGWSKMTTVHVFDESRGFCTWTYLLDSTLVATDTSDSLLWWATPDPRDKLQTLVFAMPLPDPRAKHFSEWAVVSESPVLPAGTTVAYRCRLDESGAREMTDQQREMIDRGALAALRSMKLGGNTEKTPTILCEIVRQDRGGAAELYNVVAAISVFDAEDRLQCRTIQVFSLEDHWGYCDYVDRLTIDWWKASGPVWRKAADAIQAVSEEQLLRGLGGPGGVGATRLPPYEEALNRMTAWSAGQAETSSPLASNARSSGD
jgi:hypothetical protein